MAPKPPAQEPNINELLQRLAQVKPLPAASQPFRTQQAALGSQLRDVSLDAFRGTPRLADAVQGIQQGGSAQVGWKGAVARAVGSPVGKVVLGGLNVIDAPRRAVISGVKELNDYLDIDPNTKASFSDYRQQFRDPSFGFGRVVPMAGWKGRIVGLIGDIALDPTTYLTLGGTVPTKAVAMGAERAAAEGLLRAGARVGAEDVALRAALGTKNVTGREGRFALANLVRQYGGNADEVARVAARGKSAVPDDIAKVMGLQRNGLYMFGSRVRVPLSGPLGSAMESGLVKARLFATNTEIGKKLQYLYTPGGATGTFGDLSKLRADAASGRLDKDKVGMIVSQLNGAERARAAGAGGKQEYMRSAFRTAERPDIKQFDGEIHRFVESSDKAMLSPEQARATDAFQRHFEDWHTIIEREIQTVDPEFKLGVGMRDPNTGELRYVPHVATDEFVRYKLRNPNDPFVVLLERHGSVDVMDMNNNLASRYFKAGDEFLDTGKKLEFGTIDEINAKWREATKLDFDLFETSATKIMAKYGDTVRGAYEVSAMLRELMDSDFVRLLRTQGEIDPDYLRAMERSVKMKSAEVQRLSGAARNKAEQVVQAVKKAFDTNYRTSVASQLGREIVDVRGEVRAAESVVTDAAQAVARTEALAKELTDIVGKQQAQVKLLSGYFDEKNLVMMYMGDAVNRGIDDAFELGRQAQAIRQSITEGRATAAEIQAAIDALETQAKDVAVSLERSEKVLDYYRLYGDELGPALQNIYDRLRSGPKDVEDASKLADDFANDLFSGDERVNDIMKMLMKPFDNVDYQNSTDLGPDWLGDAIDSVGETGKLLNQIPEVKDAAAGRATRKQMARAGKGGRRLTAARVNDIIGRASTVGDNHAEVADAFFFMTARELRAAYDSAGGGIAGLAAQEALAKELGENVTSRARLWNEANDAVKTIAEKRKVVEEIGSRRTQRGGKYWKPTEAINKIDEINSKIRTLRAERAKVIEQMGDAAREKGKPYLLSTEATNRVKQIDKEIAKFETSRQNVLKEIGSKPVQQGGRYVQPTEIIKRLDEIDTEIEQLRAAGFAAAAPVSSALDNTKAVLDDFVEGNAEGALEFGFKVRTVLDEAKRAKPELGDYRQWNTLDYVATQTQSAVADGVIPSKDGLKKLYDEVAGFVRTQFGNEQQIASLEKAKEELASAVSDAMTLDRRFTDVSSELFQSTQDAGVRIANYHIIHATRMTVDAISALTPSDTAIGEALYAFALSGAARQQLEHVENFQKTLAVAQEVASKIQTRVFGGSEGGRADWANTLRLAVSELSDDEREALFDVVGDLSFVEKQQAISAKIEAVRRSTPEYQKARDAVVDKYAGPDWQSAGQMERDTQYIRIKRRASIYDNPEDAALAGVSSEAEAIRNAEAIREARNRTNRLMSATPKRLNKMIDEMVAAGKVTLDEAEDLRFGVQQGEEAAVKAQAAARERAGAVGKGERAAARRARGVIQSGDESFGMARMFWLATQTNADGSTNSPQRVRDFFTMLFGDGEVRVSNSGGFKRAQSVLSGEEQVYAKQVQQFIANAKKTRTGIDDMTYWQKLADAGYVDIGRVAKILTDIEDAKTLVSDYGKEARALRKLMNKGEATLDEVLSVERRLDMAKRRVSDGGKQLAGLEREAGQLITRGTPTPEQTFKFISSSDAVFGKANNRFLYRSAALRTLARDPQSAAGFSLEAGLGRSEVLTGPWGYVEYLRGRVAELEASVEAVTAARGRVAGAQGKIDKASEALRADARDAEALASNPVLSRRVDNTMNLVSDDPDVRAAATRAVIGPKDKAWLGAKSLGADKGVVPERIAKLVNEARKTKIQLMNIEKTPEYTTALERQFRNEVLMLLGRLNLADASLEFPQNVFTERTLAAFKQFAEVGAGSKANLQPYGVIVNAMREVDQEQIANKILNLEAKDYVFVVGDRRIEESVVRDARLARNRSKFRYTAKINDNADTGRKTLVYVDKTTGKEFDFVEDLPAGVVEGQEFAFDLPVYAGKDARLSEQFDLALNGRMTTLQKKGRVSLGKEGNQFFDPNATWASFLSPEGDRLYRMDSIVGVQAPKEMNPLHPDNVFDAAQGRDIRTNFESLFEEPATPFSPRGKKLRAQLADKKAEYDKVAVRHSKHLDDANNATTLKARRTAQRKAAGDSEKLQVLRGELDVLSKQISNSNPVTQMVTVENAVRVIDYFRENPEIFSRLGLGQIDNPTDGDVLEAIRVYVNALEYGQLNPVRGAERKNVLPPSVAKRRRKFLSNKFNESEQGVLLAGHKQKTRRLAAIAKELDTAKNGGRAQELVGDLRASREELARMDKALKTSENNLRTALREGKPKIRVPKGEAPAAVAAQTLAEREKAASAAPVRMLQEAISPEAQAKAARTVEATGELAGWYEVAGSGLKDSLIATNKDIAARQSILGALESKEQDVLKRLSAMTQVIEGGNITPAEAARLDLEFKDLRFQLDGTARVPGIKKKIADAQKEIAALQKKKLSVEAKLIQERSAADVGYYAQLTVDDARRRLDVLKTSLEDIKGLRTRAKVGKAKNDGWMVEFDEFAAELDDLVQRLNALPEGPDTEKIAGVLTGYMEARANLMREQASLSELQVMAKNGSLFSSGDHIVFKKVLDDGWQQLTGSGSLKGFTNLQMRPEVKEILSNMGRLTEPVFVRSMRAWFGPYTRFFKAWALATPGYHVRNSVTNAFMFVAAGAKPQFLTEGMREYNALYKALKEGESIETYLARLPEQRRRDVARGYQAMLGSGVGQSEEVAFDTAGALTNNRWTRANKKVGVWVEQHSRFMLAYDGIKQGLDVNGATARTRKFLFDYEDVSTLDQYARTIIPFWMWTSRNFPLTIQNIYMNPRPYQWYGSVKRNLEDQEKTAALPQWMRESGAFAIPGTQYAATPDLGFNRMQQDVRMFTEPTRLASNVNPALRIPFELVAGKSFFRNRDFADTPVEVSGPVGRLASLLGTPIGLGQAQGGKQYVDEGLLYALTNAVPVLNTAERFLPSQEYYQQRGSTNPLLGFTGAPVRQVTPQMTASEQKRRLAEIQALLRAQPKPEGQ